MKLQKDSVTALVIFVSSIGLFFYTNRFPPQAQLFPKMILGLMAVLAIIMFLLSMKKQEAGSGNIQLFKNPKNFAITICVFLLYIFAMSQIGYFSATISFMILLPLFLGYRNFGILSLTVAGFLSVVYIVFIVIFERPLPAEFFLSG